VTEGSCPRSRVQCTSPGPALSPIRGGWRRTDRCARAAATLNVASSALNRQILDLEESLGVQLFERLARGVRLTSAGEMLLGHVRGWRGDFELTRAQIEDLRGARRGHVRVAVIEAMRLSLPG